MRQVRDLEAESRVRRFYEERGWNVDEEGVHHDKALFEDLRHCAAEYVSASRRKLLTHLPKTGDLLLDAASGPIQYPEHLEYSLGFSKHVCVDISQKALDQAAKKLGSRGEYVNASILDLPFQDDYFDAIVSLHTIYHIDRHQQEAAVHQLIRCIKPGHPIVIVYSNPNALSRLLSKPLKKSLALLKRSANGRSVNKESDSLSLYFYAHPLVWWNRFSNQCNITILPWRFLEPKVAKLIIPDNRLGEFILRGVMRFEELLPRLATLLGSHPMIILRKR